jgi:hypothetical protein
MTFTMCKLAALGGLRFVVDAVLQNAAAMANLASTRTTLLHHFGLDSLALDEVEGMIRI